MAHPVHLLDIGSDYDLGRAFGVLTHLRPHLDQANFVKRARAQRTQGYQIVYIEREAEIAAAAGFRIATFLAWGNVLHIGDLITHPDKKHLGLGGALLDWLIAEAQTQQCDEVHLDSGLPGTMRIGST